MKWFSFSNKRNSILNKSNFKAFAIFATFSLCTWLLIQFSKTYTQEFNLKVIFENLPKDKLVEEREKTVEIRVQTTGFRLFWIGFKNLSLRQDASNLPEEKNYLLYNTRYFKKDIAKELGLDIDNVEFLTPSIKLPFSLKTIRELPINPRIKIEYARGYGAYNPLVVFPEKVKVSGPDHLLIDIDHINTQELSLENLDKTTQGKVQLEKPHEEIILYQETTTYKAFAEKFTEGRVEVPIQIINKPQKGELSIFPKKIEVIYQVSLRNFDQVNTQDFQVICDYAKIGENDNFMIAKLKQKPEQVTHVRLSLNKVNFVIKK
ncbi:CdaR family protein [uncultured Mesonia sp.]|uniref:CdaR family protein n=1 Tax=uncultured Mesonia sp. TaxID=399731 RepID=UPI00374F8F1C